MSAVMIIASVWLKVVDPGSKTFLVNDLYTYILDIISNVKKLSLISDQSLKIFIRATVVVNFTGIGTVSRAYSRFRLVGIRKSNQKSFCVIFSLVSHGSVHERPYQSANPSIRFHYPDNNFIFENSKDPRFINLK